MNGNINKQNENIIHLMQ